MVDEEEVVVGKEVVVGIIPAVTPAVEENWHAHRNDRDGCR